MRRLLSLKLAQYFAVLTVACGHPDSSRVAVSFDGTSLVGWTHKVHGVTTVEFPALAFDRAAQFVIDTAPVAILGRVGNRNPPERERFRDIAFLASGGYAALRFAGIQPHLYIFDHTGSLLHMIAVTSFDLLALGDTLLLNDGGSGLTYLTSSGDTLETVNSAPQPTSAALSGYSSPVGRLGASHLVWRVAMPNIPDTTRSVRTPIGVVTSGLKHDSARLIDSIPGSERRPIIVHYGDHDQALVVAVTFGGYARVVVWDNRIAVATGMNGYAIDLLDADGRVVRRVHVAVPRRPVTESMRDSVRLGMDWMRWPLEPEGTPTSAEARAHRLALQPFADSLPAYGLIFATPHGVLWVLDESSPGDTAWNATAFRSDGAILGRLHGSGGMPPDAFDDDRFVIRSPDGTRGMSYKVFRFRLPK